MLYLDSEMATITIYDTVLSAPLSTFLSTTETQPLHTQQTKDRGYRDTLVKVVFCVFLFLLLTGNCFALKFFAWTMKPVKPVHGWRLWVLSLGGYRKLSTFGASSRESKYYWKLSGSLLKYSALLAHNDGIIKERKQIQFHFQLTKPYYCSSQCC